MFHFFHFNCIGIIFYSGYWDEMWFYLSYLEFWYKTFWPSSMTVLYRRVHSIALVRFSSVSGHTRHFLLNFFPFVVVIGIFATFVGCMIRWQLVFARVVPALFHLTIWSRWWRGSLHNLGWTYRSSPLPAHHFPALLEILVLIVFSTSISATSSPSSVLTVGSSKHLVIS